jgi:hypothetical protein
MSQLRRSLLCTTAAAVLAAPALLVAQGAADPAVRTEPLQSVAINPLAIPFGVFSAEYEVALPTPGFTFGVGGTYFSDDDDRDSWVEAKALYYPNERTFRSFSVGLTAGVHSARRNTGSCDFLGCSAEPRSQTAPTLGVLVSYDWLLGRQERFRVGLGAGAKRILKDVGGNDPLEQVWPDGRFVIGFVW